MDARLWRWSKWRVEAKAAVRCSAGGGAGLDAWRARCDVENAKEKSEKARTFMLRVSLGRRTMSAFAWYWLQIDSVARMMPCVAVDM